MRSIGFTGAGLDRGDHLRLDPEKMAAVRAMPEARLLRLDGLNPIVDEAGSLAWDPIPADFGETLFLGFGDELPLFAPLVRLDRPPPRAWALFRLLAMMDARDAAIWGAARSVNEWHYRHSFCSVCGTATAPFRAGWGRLCPNCGAEHFPRVDPVVIMLAEHQGRVLLGRQPQYPPNRYSALAGFVEPGELIEEAVARELFEEAGIHVSKVRYLASQPWPFPGQLMIACIAEAEDDALRIDPHELEDAFWATRDEVQGALAGVEGARFLAPPPYAIANSLLTRWSEGE